MQATTKHYIRHRDSPTSPHLH